MNWISLNELILVHQQVVEKTGGVSGIINPGALESALSRPFTALSGDEMFPDLLAKTAALIHSIILFHPFVDGNKRTALAAANICLRLNHRRITPSPEVERFFWEIARGEKDLEEIKSWLLENTEPTDPNS